MRLFPSPFPIEEPFPEGPPRETWARESESPDIPTPGAMDFRERAMGCFVGAIESRGFWKLVASERGPVAMVERLPFIFSLFKIGDFQWNLLRKSKSRRKGKDALDSQRKMMFHIIYR
jgi:hypothetical protein